MKQVFKKWLSLCLALTFVLTAGTVGFGASAAKAAPVRAAAAVADGETDYVPTIVIHGVFQGENRLYENGEMVLKDNGDPVNQLLIHVTKKDIVHYALRGILPLILSFTLQRDVGLSDAVAEIVADLFKYNAKDNNGEHIYDVRVIRYPESAGASEAARNRIYNVMPLEGYAQIAGDDNLYLFAYDSFDSVSKLADELYAFIQNVKAETGSEKVNLVPVSQGGSIAVEMIHRYREEMARDLHRLLFIVPALNGTNVLGKIFSSGFVKEDATLYRDLWSHLFADDDDLYLLQYVIPLALHLLPKDTVYSVLDRTVASLADTLLVNCTCMWALTPASEYDVLYDRYLKDGSREKIREELEFFHEAQVSALDNILYLQSAGVQVFDLVDYDCPMYPLFDGWADWNGDGVIHLDSSSAGAYSVPVHETLPDDYTQSGKYCTCTDGFSHISPDRKVDASAGALCETTFYFDEANHEATGRNDVIISLAIRILTDDSFLNVHSDPDAFPQFNTARHTKQLRGYLAKAKQVDPSALSAEDAAELQAAIAQCDAMLATTVVDLDAFYSAQNRLYAILEKLDLYQPEEPMSDSDTRILNLLERLSDWVYRVVGPRGISDAALHRHDA